MPKRKLHKSSKNRIKTGMYFRSKMWKKSDVHTITAAIMGVLGALVLLYVMVLISNESITL